MLAEARQAMLLQRVSGDPGALGAQGALESPLWAAPGLGRDDIGALAPGMAADFIAYRLERLDFAALHDPLAALVFARRRRWTERDQRQSTREGRRDRRPRHASAGAAARCDQPEDAAGRVIIFGWKLVVRVMEISIGKSNCELPDS